MNFKSMFLVLMVFARTGVAAEFPKAICDQMALSLAQTAAKGESIEKGEKLFKENCIQTQPTPAPTTGTTRVVGGTQPQTFNLGGTPPPAPPAPSAASSAKKPSRSSEVFANRNAAKPERVALETAKVADATVFSDPQIATIGKVFAKVAGTQSYKRGTETPLAQFKRGNIQVKTSNSALGYEIKAFRATGSPVFAITNNHLAFATGSAEKPIIGDLLPVTAEWLLEELEGKNPPIPNDLAAFIVASKEGGGLVTAPFRALGGLVRKK